MPPPPRGLPVFLLPADVPAAVRRTGALPYFVSYALFQVATLVPFVLVMRKVLGAPDWRFVPALLAFPAVFWTLGVGQNAFLTAALFGGFTLLIDRRPRLRRRLARHALLQAAFRPAGAHRPGGRPALEGIRRRARLGRRAGVDSRSCCSAGTLGRPTCTPSPAPATSINPARIDFAGIETPFGAVRLLGFPPGPAYALQLVSTVTMAGLTAWIWHRRSSQPLRCASLLAATLLAVPLALLYDKCCCWWRSAGWCARPTRTASCRGRRWCYC